ncbi:hypothetical protein HDV00_009659 [Rhizophlyctis rosea]|nr:hypothetical protein HDV00_009659 [Rhizophlyctis rosea]
MSDVSMNDVSMSDASHSFNLLPDQSHQQQQPTQRPKPSSSRKKKDPSRRLPSSVVDQDDREKDAQKVLPEPQQQQEKDAGIDGNESHEEEEDYDSDDDDVQYSDDEDGDGDDGEGGMRNVESGNSSTVDDKELMRMKSQAHPPIIRQTKYKKRKVIDVAATRELYKQLMISEYPSTETRQKLGKKLGMTPRAVQIWFQNKRQKRKRMLRDGGRDPDMPEDLHEQALKSNYYLKPTGSHRRLDDDFDMTPSRSLSPESGTPSAFKSTPASSPGSRLRGQPLPGQQYRTGEIGPGDPLPGQHLRGEPMAAFMNGVEPAPGHHLRGEPLPGQGHRGDALSPPFNHPDFTPPATPHPKGQHSTSPYGQADSNRSTPNLSGLSSGASPTAAARDFLHPLASQMTATLAQAFQNHPLAASMAAAAAATAAVAANPLNNPFLPALLSPEYAAYLQEYVRLNPHFAWSSQQATAELYRAASAHMEQLLSGGGLGAIAGMLGGGFLPGLTKGGEGSSGSSSPTGGGGGEEGEGGGEGSGSGSPGKGGSNGLDLLATVALAKAMEEDYVEGEGSAEGKKRKGKGRGGKGKSGGSVGTTPSRGPSSGLPLPRDGITDIGQAVIAALTGGAGLGLDGLGGIGGVSTVANGEGEGAKGRKEKRKGSAAGLEGGGGEEVGADGGEGEGEGRERRKEKKRSSKEGSHGRKSKKARIRRHEHHNGGGGDVGPGDVIAVGNGNGGGAGEAEVNGDGVGAGEVIAVGDGSGSVGVGADVGVGDVIAVGKEQ